MPFRMYDGYHVLASREIQFLNRNETGFPQLMRHCNDFGFKVIEVLVSRTARVDTAEREFVLATDDYRHCKTANISPPLESLQALEAYVKANSTDILHDYLFGFVEEDIIDANSKIS